MRKTRRFATILLMIAAVIGGCRNGGIGNEETEVKSEEQSEKVEIEETVTQVDEANTEIIKSEKYTVCDDGYISFQLQKDEEKVSLICAGEIKNVEKASIVFAQLYSIMSADTMTGYSPSVAIYCDRAMVALAAGQVMGSDDEGNPVTGLPNWVITDTDKFTISEDEMNEIVTEIQDCLNDFVGG